MTTATITQHKYYDLACRAYYGTSFTPYKRAISDCEWYDAICQELTALGKDWAVDKFSQLFVKSLSAKSRCYSSMIAGPSRFPVARMEKLNRWEGNVTQAMFDFVEKVRRPAREKRTEIEYSIQEKEYHIGDTRVLQNTTDNRLQLFFPGKPDADLIANLKRHGFKWSPRNKAWQRQLTPNALSALSYVFPETERIAS